MKRYIKNSFELGADVIHRASIIIDIDVPYTIAAATKWTDYTRFPGAEQFRLDVLDMLVNEFKFDVMGDNYNGVTQKGWMSKHQDSDSIYFNTFYDLRNTEELFQNKNYGIDPANVSGKVFCYILFRFSDHDVDSRFDLGHRNFYEANKQNHADSRNDVLLHRDENIIIDEAALQQHYKDALDDLRYELENRIAGWVRYAKRRYPEGI